jgi:hypothetical protein
MTIETRELKIYKVRCVSVEKISIAIDTSFYFKSNTNLDAMSTQSAIFRSTSFWLLSWQLSATSSTNLRRLARCRYDL